MPLNYRALATCALLWSLPVYMNLFDPSYSLNGFSEDFCGLKLTVQNFRLILSWELENASVVPTHYTLQYTVMSKLEDAKAIGNCTNITSSFCDVTDVWEEMHETYIPLLEGFRGNTALLHCVGSVLATNLSFEPPEFGIVGFTDHINVTVTFPSVIPKIYGKDISHHLSLVIKEHSEEMVRVHKLQINGSISGNFSHVIDNLIPNTNYCISVYFEPKGVGKVIRSPLKCTLLQPGQESALVMVPPPENVRMNSVNFKNILQWESPAFDKGNLTFTAQQKSSYRGFQNVCNSIISTQCDFVGLSKYGNYTLRVRAEFANEHSKWVAIPFSPEDDTLLGPPGIHIEAFADSLHMHFSAPQVHNEPGTWTMKDFYPSLAYNVQYWKEGHAEKIQVTLQNEFEVLKNLEPWTTYCIQVQGIVPIRNKMGQWSEPVCERTNDETPPWIVPIILMVSVFAGFLLLIGCFALLWCIYKKTKYTLAPGNALPQHLKEFLGHPHQSTRLFFSFPFSDENEVFDKLSIITEDCESSKQNPSGGDNSGVPSGPGPPEIVSNEETVSADLENPTPQMSVPEK
ncbi:interleukin-10 receptor subunit beta-like isoform 3-T3 [Thomomys bottae]